MLEQLLSFMSLAETVADMNAEDGSFYKLVFWNSEPEWFDYKADLDEEQEKTYFCGDWFDFLTTEARFHRESNRLRYDVSLAHVTPGGVHWSMTLKHTSIECETLTLTREQVEKLLDELTS